MMQKLGMDTTFEIIYTQYKKSMSKEGKEELIEKFCNILFGNDCNNL